MKPQKTKGYRQYKGHSHAWEFGAAIVLLLLGGVIAIILSAYAG